MLTLGRVLDPSWEVISRPSRTLNPKPYISSNEEYIGRPGKCDLKSLLDLAHIEASGFVV